MEKIDKPAWFELADNDQPAQVAPKARKGGIFAVITTLALTGVAGWGFISSEEFPATVASASSAVIEKVSGNSTSASNTVNPITAPTGYEDEEDDFRPAQSVTAASATSVASSTTAINPPSSVGSSTGNNPILPPSGNSDDDDDDDDDDDHKGDRKKSREDHDNDDEEDDD